jgi:NADH dehydrogenase/NADH:ubiquinone oxidoreductase subunit G
MKRPSLKDRFGEDESSIDDEMTEAIADALSADDKVVEIRPAKRSNGMGLKRRLLMVAGVIGLAYWFRNSQKPDELIGSVKEKTADRTHQAAASIEAGSETASERIEAGSEQIGETVQEAGEAVEGAGEKAAARTEEAGEGAAERTEDAGEKATGETGTDASGSSGR